MNSVLNVELPNELLPFKENIEATIKPFIEIKTSVHDELSLWQSKFGGLPYLPKDFQYPLNSKGQPMPLLAQINLAELPTLEKFPQKGILQFYISGGDDVYGICFENLANQKDFRVQYFSDVVEDESRLITDFEFVPKFDMLPFETPCSLKFSLQHAPITTGDYRFKSLVFGQNLPTSEDDLYKIYDEYESVFPSEGHRIGGYPYFTQWDPRHTEEYQDKGYVLLFQMDSDFKMGIMWGDCGVANFFISEEDLEKTDFSRVLYNWDCC